MGRAGKILQRKRLYNRITSTKADNLENLIARFDGCYALNLENMKGRSYNVNCQF